MKQLLPVIYKPSFAALEALHCHSQSIIINMNTLSAVILLAAVSCGTASVFPIGTYGSSYAAHAIDHSLALPAAPLVAAAPPPAPLVPAPAPLFAPGPAVLPAPAPAPLYAPGPAVLPAPAPYLSPAGPFYAPGPYLV
ncbi:angiomotin [Halyomorpha halys]|uniref:angiomotin n=1 Tax=Halyomorpha halys TaxID=286706 RepID=UPI0006D4F39E|nr:LIM domain-binding protein 3 [Halyomorpha halys]